MGNEYKATESGFVEQQMSINRIYEAATMHQIQKPSRSSMSALNQFNQDNQISLIRQVRKVLKKLELEENGSTKQSIVVRLRVDEIVDSNVPTPEISFALSQGVKKGVFLYSSSPGKYSLPKEKNPRTSRGMHDLFASRSSGKNPQTSRGIHDLFASRSSKSKRSLRTSEIDNTQSARKGSICKLLGWLLNRVSKKRQATP